MRSKASWAACFLLATAAAGAALIACTADDDDEIFVSPPDGGPLDATLGDMDAQMDSEPIAPDDAAGDDDGAVDAWSDADADAGFTPPHGIYAFSGYCGAVGLTTTVACPTSVVCGTFDGGIAAQSCPTPNTECVVKAGDAGGLDRVFDCLRTKQAVWALNAICADPYDDCSDAGAVVAPCIPGDAAVEGDLCVASLTPPATRCATTDSRYVCQAGNASTWVFNGYCDAGATAACGTTLSECTLEAGVVGGATCATPFGRCLAGNRVFVCAAH